MKMILIEMELKISKTWVKTIKRRVFFSSDQIRNDVHVSRSSTGFIYELPG